MTECHNCGDEIEPFGTGYYPLTFEGTYCSKSCFHEKKEEVGRATLSL